MICHCLRSRPDDGRGRRGGGPFTLACNADEVLVGMNGTTNTYVQQVSPLCVRVNQNGEWIGTPVARGITGSAGPTAYSKQCPVNTAISGFRGRASQYVNQIDLECRTLTPSGKLTGEAHSSARWSRHGYGVVLIVAAPTTRATRSSAVRAAGWTTSASSAARPRPRS
jgi:hypothetical protein